MSEERIVEEAGKGSDVASKILKKNLLNIVRKVQDGKTLSHIELNQIQSLADGGEGTKLWAKNQVELAEILGIERKTIQRWLKLPNCPQARSDGRYSVVEFREWATKTGRKVIDDTTDDEKSRLEIRRLRTICERLDLELEVTKGTYTSNDEVTKSIFRMIGAARKVLAAMPAQLAPQVVGLSIPEAEQRIREQVDNAMKQLHEGKWS